MQHRTSSRRPPPLICVGLASLAVVAFFSGCNSIGYYAQAVKGHCQVVSRQTSCDKLLASTNTPPELQAKLELAQELCAFAERELGLSARGAYRRYADLERPYVVWNVYATPEFSLEARTWWYPFVGSLDYRGYFNENSARQYADKAVTKGFDVYVEGVEAYSTLGWFNDPLLNTFLYHQEPILAEVLFHELAHQRVFVSGDTDFNEAFATVAAQAGVCRWLQSRGDVATLARYESALERNDQFVRIVQSARTELEQLYEVPPALQQHDSLEKGKNDVIAALRENFQELLAESRDYAGYQPWFGTPINNAKLNSVATYYDLVPAFNQLLDEQEDNLEGFYDAVKTLTKLRKTERHQKLEALNGSRSIERSTSQ